MSQMKRKRNFYMSQIGKLKSKLSKSIHLKVKIVENQNLSLNNKNKELVRENASLLKELEYERNCKFEINKQLIETIVALNDAKLPNIRNKLITVVTNVENSHREINELQQKANSVYNRMINDLSDELKHLTNKCRNAIETGETINDNVTESVSRVLPSSSLRAPHSRPLNSHEIFASRKMSLDRLDRLNHNFNDLSIITEQSIDGSVKSLDIPIVSSAVNPKVLQTPENDRTYVNDNKYFNSNISHNEQQYALTPIFDSKRMRTPSIYNYDIPSICEEDSENDATIDDHNLIGTTDVNWDDGNGIAASSTPLNTNINHNKRGKKSFRRVSFSVYSSTSEHLSFSSVSDTNDDTIIENSVRSKTKSHRNNSNGNSTVMNGSTSSYSRRTRPPVTYKEPSSKVKIHAGDKSWCRDY